MVLTEEIKFEEHGENLTVVGNGLAVTWAPIYSGGLAFTNLPVNQGDKITVQLSGSGEIRIGVIQIDPIFFGNLRKHVYGADLISQISSIPLSNVSPIFVTIMRGKRQDGDTLTLRSVTTGKRFANVKRNRGAWIVFEIIYGTVSVEIVKIGGLKDYKIHENMDVNVISTNGSDAITSELVKMLFFSPTKISLVHPNPWTSCTLNRPIHRGEIITFNCQPIARGRRKPKLFYLKILISESKPDLTTFDITEYSDVYLTKLWENDECQGYIQLSLSYSGHLILINSKGDCCTANIKKKNVCVVFTLFKVKVRFLT